MRNSKLLFASTLVGTLLLGACGIGEESKENKQLSETKKDLDKTKKELDKVKEQQSQDNNTNQKDTQKSDVQQTDSKTNTNKTPSMVEVLRMIDADKNVDGIVDQEGNTWKQNQDIAVSYTNPQGQSYSSSLTYDGEIDGTDFVPSYDEDETPEGIFAEEPDQDVIDELQSEIDNAGLQTEMEAKQKELDDYINSFN